MQIIYKISNKTHKRIHAQKITTAVCVAPLRQFRDAGNLLALGCIAPTTRVAISSNEKSGTLSPQLGPGTELSSLLMGVRGQSRPSLRKRGSVAEPPEAEHFCLRRRPLALHFLT